MRDCFEPHHEPARSIYNAFQAEARRRKGRGVDAWMKAERDAVLREAARQAQSLGLRCPTMEEVTAAECGAMGSTDYGAKWAYGVVDAMRKGSTVLPVSGELKVG